jgi:hypothetical protein
MSTTRARAAHVHKLTNRVWSCVRGAPEDARGAVPKAMEAATALPERKRGRAKPEGGEDRSDARTEGVSGQDQLVVAVLCRRQEVSDDGQHRVGEAVG